MSGLVRSGVQEPLRYHLVLAAACEWFMSTEVLQQLASNTNLYRALRALYNVSRFEYIFNLWSADFESI